MSKALEAPINEVAVNGAVVAAPKKKKQPYPFWLGGTSVYCMPVYACCVQYE